MNIYEVTTKKDAKLFHDVARLIYKGDKNWICLMDSDIEAVFDPLKNGYFNDGKAIRWILFDDSHRLAGRVAAFFNKMKANTYKQPTGGLGFFECIDNYQAAKLLFDKCKEWLQLQGMEAMDGPINFGENDQYQGLLVEGFTPPSYGMNYHHPYYRKFFEDYGFSPYFNQTTNYLDLTIPFPERFWKIAEWIAKKPGFTFEHFKMANAKKYINDLKTIYDQAWSNHEHFTPLNSLDILSELQKAKPILDEQLIWFAYHEGKPIAFLVMFPDVNQIFRHFNGKLGLINKCRFAYYLWKKEITRTKITVMGVVPSFQGYGIESAIFRELRKVFDHRPHYTEIELSWVGDFNPRMEALHKAVGGKFGKKHITYRKLFAEKSEPQQATIIRKG
ncbi:MAG: GNAT family N-acetyltransferase [Bacteroidota bacterium]|jgi:GNAT superfamily N-acetyltransferase|nr:GNAT family N-acetyltransferase [Bacteroidota bacterium]NLH32522.1 GNAT family N-acetyltransferase [Lentimicrobium sp.]